MNWHQLVGYHPDPEYKAYFHYQVRKRLDKLAAALGWPDDSYNLYSIRQEKVFSGIVVLHHDTVCIEVDQSTGMPPGWEIKIRPCASRADKDGRRNRFAPIEMLDNIPAFARRVTDTVTADQGL